MPILGSNKYVILKPSIAWIEQRDDLKFVHISLLQHLLSKPETEVGFHFAVLHDPIREYFIAQDFTTIYEIIDLGCMVLGKVVTLAPDLLIEVEILIKKLIENLGI